MDLPNLYVEADKRRDVEAFAQKMEELGPPDTPHPEFLKYARMDAAALLSRIAKGKTGLMEELQEAVMNRDLEAFASALEKNNAIGKKELENLNRAIENKDQDAFANILRSLGMAKLEELKYASEMSKVTGTEIANPVDPLMGNERRLKVDLWFSDIPVPPGHVSELFPDKSKDTIAYAAMRLGDDHDTWEEDCLMHPYLFDAANAQLDLLQESRGVGHLDGRCNGTRGTVPNPYYG